jgi:hypothetical protein
MVVSIFDPSQISPNWIRKTSDNQQININKESMDCLIPLSTIIKKALVVQFASNAQCKFKKLKYIKKKDMDVQTIWF